MKTACVFPGQGSQNVGMLKELADDYPVVLETFTEASSALGYDLWDLSLLYTSPSPRDRG